MLPLLSLYEELPLILVMAETIDKIYALITKLVPKVFKRRLAKWIRSETRDRSLATRLRKVRV